MIISLDNNNIIQSISSINGVPVEKLTVNGALDMLSSKQFIVMTNEYDTDSIVATRHIVDITF